MDPIATRVAGFGILPGITLKEYLFEEWEFYMESEDGYDVVYNVKTHMFAYVLGGIEYA